MRFKCVSKQWYALINNPRFVAKHLSISMHNNRSTTRVLLKRLVHKDTDTNSDTQEVFSLFKFRNHIDIDNGGEHEHEHEHEHELELRFFSEVEDINIPHSMSLKTRGSSLHIIGHCNGIICLVPAVSGEVILWNPVIQEFKHHPPQPYLPDLPEINLSAVNLDLFELMKTHFLKQKCYYSVLHHSNTLKFDSESLVYSGVRPHLSLLYGNLTEEERKKAREKVSVLDESITSMSFPITRLALFKIDYKDKSLKSWDNFYQV